MNKKIRGITVQLGGETTGLTKALESADRALRATQSELKAVQKDLKFDPSNGKLAVQQFQVLKQAIEQASDKLKMLEQAQADVDKAFKNGDITAEQYREFEREVERTKGQLESLKKQLADSGKTAADTSEELDKASDSTAKLGQSADQSGKKLNDYTESAKKNAGDLVKAFAAVAAAFLAVAKTSLDAGTEFDKSVSQIGATMGFTADELAESGSEATQTMAELRDFAKQMGADTAFNASEAADALNYMALAGYDADKSMNMLPKVLNLAAAGSIGLADASDMVTDAQSALGLSMDETSELVDKMAKTASRTNTSVAQLGEGILKIGGTARSLKGGTTELAASLGVLADNGIKGAEGGTHLRNVLLSLQKAAVDGKIAVGDMAVEVYDVSGEMRALPDIFGDINTAMHGMTEAGADAAKTALFNKTDLSAVNALLSTSGERWTALTGEIDNAAGAAQAMAETQLDNLAGDITLLQSAAEGAKIAVSDRLSPSLRKAAQLGTALISEMSEEFGEHGLSGAIEAAHKVLERELGDAARVVYGIEAATKAAAAAFVVYKSGMVLSGVIGSLKTVNSLMREGKTLAEAMNAAEMANPYVLIATAAISAGIALKSLADTQTDLIEEAADSYDLLDEKQKAVVDSVNAVAKASSESRSGYEQAAAAAEMQADKLQALTDKLFELDDAEVLSADSKAQMKAVVDELNSSVDGLNIELDEETGHLKTQRSEIEKNISSMKKRAQAAAAEERLVELYKEQFDAENALKNAEEEREAAHDRLQRLNREYADSSAELIRLNEQAAAGYATDEMLSRIDELTPKVHSLNDEISLQKDVVGELDGAYVSAKEAVSSVGDDISAVTAAVEENGGIVPDSAENVSNALDKVADSAENAAGKTSQVFTITEEQVEDTLGKIDELTGAYNSKVNAQEGVLESWVDKNLSMDEDSFDIGAWQNVLNSTQNELNDWDGKMDALAERTDKNGRRIVNDGLLEHLKTLGPEGRKYVEALTNASDEELEKFSLTWETTYTGIPKIAEKQHDELKSTTNKKIKEMLSDVESQNDDIKNVFGRLGLYGIDGYIEGFNDPEKRAELEAAVRGMVQQAKAAVEDEEDSHSPSKVFRKLGSYAGEGYALGITDEMKSAAEASKALVRSAVNASGGAELRMPSVMAQTAENRRSDENSSAVLDLLKAAAAGTVKQQLVIGDNGQDILAETLTPKINVLLGRNMGV